MAYRRRQGNPRPATYEDYRSSPVAAEDPPSLAAQAIHGSSANRESSLSSAYSESAFTPSSQSRPSSTYLKDSNTYEYTSLKSINDNETKSGFWGVLARKAKSIIDDDKASQQFENLNKFRPHKLDASTNNQYHEFHQPRESSEGQRKKRLDSLATSLYNIGGKVGNALEEGFSIVENRTADIIQETRKLNIRRKERVPDMQNLGTEFTSLNDAVQIQRDQETQLKASRDVANAMAAKAKLLLRELKTVKADLAFAKERSTQLEEENKVLRESRNKEDQLQDDDLIRLQLETLLAEKARLAHENSIYARENRLLREIVEYHQLTMQDVVYLDESNEEVTEVYPSQLPTISSPRKSRSPSPCISTPRALTPTVSLTRQDQLPTLPSPRTLSPQVSITPSDVVSSVVSSPPTVTGGVLETIHADIDQESLEGKKVLSEGA